jgi:hypothetical protein
MAQGKLREASLYFFENKCRGPSPATAGSRRQAYIAFFISLLEISILATFQESLCLNCVRREARRQPLDAPSSLAFQEFSRHQVPFRMRPDNLFQELAHSAGAWGRLPLQPLIQRLGAGLANPHELFAR